MDSDALGLLRRIGYPEAWLTEAAPYTPRDAYTVFDPRWADEVSEIPETTVDVIVQRQAQQRPDAAAMPKNTMGTTLKRTLCPAGSDR